MTRPESQTRSALVNHLGNTIRQPKRGNAVGIYSVCTSHPTALQAAIRQASSDDTHAHLEATSNQVKVEDELVPSAERSDLINVNERRMLASLGYRDGSYVGIADEQRIARPSGVRCGQGSRRTARLLGGLLSGPSRTVHHRVHRIHRTHRGKSQ